MFAYLRDAIYNPGKASLDVSLLPSEFQTFAKGLLFYNGIISETRRLARSLADGELQIELPPSSNEVASPLKKLHASLKHLTWQTQQVAKGDYNQHVEFMGEFSGAFNNMVAQLEENRKNTLSEKSKLEMYVNLLLANCPDPILLFGSDRRLVSASESFLKCCGLCGMSGLLGSTAREIFGRYVSDEIYNEKSKKIILDSVSKDASEIEIEADFNGSGSLRHYQVSVSPMLDGDGVWQGIIILLHDTTDIDRARREAESAKELAEAASRTKSEFLARMSHEMRTPMNAILGMTRLYGVTDDAARKENSVKIIDEAARGLLAIIGNILNMTQIEENKITLAESEFNLSELAVQASDAARFQAVERGQRFNLIFGADTANTYVADKQRLSQVIDNLLSNAVKFTPASGEITLGVEKVSEDEKSCVFRFNIKDTGSGIAREKFPLLFQPFEQVDGGLSRKYGGIGLGLYLSKKIVELMGGSIWLESETGKGTSFFFDVPLKKFIPEEAEESIDGIFAGRTVLVVDDVEINREIVASFLEDTGAEILHAKDGGEAVGLYENSPVKIDVILMDIHMPNMDGYEATRRIRSLEASKKETVPIIALSANDFPEDVEKCIACGMNGHLGKPVDMDKLIMTIKKRLT